MIEEDIIKSVLRSRTWILESGIEKIVSEMKEEQRKKDEGFEEFVDRIL